MSTQSVCGAFIAVSVWVCGFGVSAVAADDSVVAFFPRTVIYPGDVIAESAIVDQKIRVLPGRAADAYPGRNDIVGKISRRTLMRGQPITTASLREKDAVMQGRTYTLIYQTLGLTVRGTGVPLQSVGAGEMVRVRNPDTGNIIVARAKADGTLVVEGP
ncbi:MAG: flagellar basal body P-ring formation chaperone FlgA [Hyphomicrobium sp.]|nr:flagellar basal body P-ring formation chaperone FlgA [Hyphomicrobium sp.]